jgi:hypothetical protein
MQDLYRQPPYILIFVTDDDHTTLLIVDIHVRAKRLIYISDGPQVVPITKFKTGFGAMLDCHVLCFQRFGLVPRRTTTLFLPNLKVLAKKGSKGMPK